MIKSLVLAAVTAVGALGATSANAGVSWSVNIDTPVVGTIVSRGPGYHGHAHRHGLGHHDGRIYVPAPVYAPVPIDRARPPVAYFPPAAFYRPAPVVYTRFYPRYHPGWRHGHDRWDARGHGGRR